MDRSRAQAIIIRNNEVLFVNGHFKSRHCFVGGGIEENESPIEAVLREMREEINVEGNIVFQFNSELKVNQYTFLVDIGQQICTLGYDPEEVEIPFEEKSLQEIIWISLNQLEKFTQKDIEYFKLLINECHIRKYNPDWIEPMNKLVKTYKVMIERI